MAAAKSGESTIASGWPARTTSPALASTEMSRPASGGMTREVWSSSSAIRAGSDAASGRGSSATVDISSSASCGEPGSNVTRKALAALGAISIAGLVCTVPSKCFMPAKVATPTATPVNAIAAKPLILLFMVCPVS